MTRHRPSNISSTASGVVAGASAAPLARGELDPVDGHLRTAPDRREGALRRRKNRRGKDTTEGKLAYSGPRQPPNLPKVKLGLTSDELLADSLVERPVSHPYSDAPTVVPQVRCYSIAELLAE